MTLPRRHRRLGRTGENRTTQKLVERAEREGFQLYQPDAEHAKSLGEIMGRIAAPLVDVNTWDAFTIFLGLSAYFAVHGAENQVDGFPPMKRETYLKNCAERFDAYVRMKTDNETKVNTDGGDA